MVLRHRLPAPILLQRAQAILEALGGLAQALVLLLQLLQLPLLPLSAFGRRRPFPLALVAVLVGQRAHLRLWSIKLVLYGLLWLLLLLRFVSCLLLLWLLLLVLLPPEPVQHVQEIVAPDVVLGQVDNLVRREQGQRIRTQTETQKVVGVLGEHGR